MNRYDVYWAKLDPVVGSELAKTRPVVIVSMDELNSALATVTVCPLTSQLHDGWRSRLRIICAGKVADIAVDHIRAISKKRLVKKMDALTASEAAALRRIITEMYGEE